VEVIVVSVMFVFMILKIVLVMVLVSVVLWYVECCWKLVMVNVVRGCIRVRCYFGSCILWGVDLVSWLLMSEVR